MTIRYELTAESGVQLAIYDCLGQEIRALIASREAKGAHFAVWDCRDDRGRPVSSGVYFCRLKTGRVTKGELMVVVR